MCVDRMCGVRRERQYVRYMLVNGVKKVCKSIFPPTYYIGFYSKQTSMYITLIYVYNL